MLLVKVLRNVAMGAHIFNDLSETCLGLYCLLDYQLYQPL